MDYKYVVLRITGVLPANFSSEEVVRVLMEAGAKSISIVSREVQIECTFNTYPVIKEVLKKIRAEDVKIREARYIENTVMQSGTSTDPSGSIKVTLVPAPRPTGRKLLSISLSENFELKEHEVPDFVQKSKVVVNKVLDKANITHCLIAIEILKRPKDFEKALELAIIHTLLETNGIYVANGYGL